MQVPEQLFARPLLKDIKTQQVDLVFRAVNSSVVAGQVIAPNLYTIPPDRVGVVTAWGVAGTPDPAGGILYNAVLNCTVSGLSGFVLDGQTTGAFAAAAGTKTQVGNSGSIWLPGGTVVGIACYFTTVGNHSADFCMSLVTFPRGNVSYG